MASLRHALLERLHLPGWVVLHAGAVADAAIAGGLFTAAVLTLANAEPNVLGSRNPDALAYLLAMFLTLPLVVRRRWPVVVLTVTVIGLVGFNARDYAGTNVDFFGPMLAFYTVAAHTSRRTSIGAALLIAGGVLLAAVLARGPAEPAEEDAVGNVVTVILLIAGVWLLGDSARGRRIYGEQLAAQADALRSARLELADQAVSQERLRIARELHDVVAHHMSAIVVQSALAQDRLEPDPPAARRALTQVEEIGRSALREMRQILGVLRQAGEERGALDPSPSMGDLDRLYVQARQGGLTVNAVVRGDPGPIPPAVELAAYRIVQEGLTNALKHAPGARVEVCVDYSPRSVRVEVSDDGGANGGRTVSRASTGGGQGLIGMRERVSLLGGAFEAGPDAGGFRLAATLPLDGTL